MTGRLEYAIVFTLAAANFAQLSARISLSPLVPEFIDAFAVSKSEVGLALTLMWATYALLQYPSGVLGDRFGERRVVLVALATLSVGSLLVAGSVSFLVFAVAALTIGTSTGLYFTAGTSLLNRRFENTGRVLGFHTAGAALSGLVTPIVVATVATRFGWRIAALFPLVLAAPILGLFVLTVPAMPPIKPETRLREQFKLRTVVVLFSRPDVAYTVLLAAAFSFSFQSFVSFFPTFLVEFSALSPFSAPSGASFSSTSPASICDLSDPRRPSSALVPPSYWNAGSTSSAVSSRTRSMSSKSWRASRTTCPNPRSAKRSSVSTQSVGSPATKLPSISSGES